MILNIWRFTDKKPGHDSQSIGLCNAISEIKKCNIFDIETDSAFNVIKNVLSNKFPRGENITKPDILIGAGHKTHISMLSAKYIKKGKIIVLMKPSLPISFFDLCLIPKHDRPKTRKNVIETNGALNPMKFNENKSLDEGLILLGGLSNHYKWDNNIVISQVKNIITNKDNKNWTLADSPRTPKGLIQKLSLYNKNVKILHSNTTSMTQLHNYIFNANHIWVSPDSVSMVYESLSSGASVGILELPIKNTNRINEAITSLIEKKEITSYSSWLKNKELRPFEKKFNEAKRCALIMLEKGILC